MPDAPNNPVTRPAVTGTYNPVELRPFSIPNIVCPDRWDPTQAPLPVTWEINDPNRRILNGRILYAVNWKGKQVVVDRRVLKPKEWTPGIHELADGDRWDGIVREGIPDRIHHAATADMSGVTVEVQVWNTGYPEPAARAGSRGRTERKNEWISTAAARTDIDAIVEARWDTHWVIPAEDPEEPAKGKAGMIIRVKNVAEHTPVHIAVRRIRDIPDPSGDLPYVDDVGSADVQPGLQEATVKGGRVLLKNGKIPTCQFNNFDQHWIEEGNNFYSFWLAFGEGDSMPASERDYESSERACLHMRFTVFIHTASIDLAFDIKEDIALHRFFRAQTRYYRSYLMTGPPKSAQQWADYFKHRYIVVINSHGGADCFHEEHPKETMPAKGKHPAFERRKEMYHSGFPPDRYVCPDRIYDTPEVHKELEEARKHYMPWGGTFGGCGNDGAILQYPCLGKRGGYSMQLWPVVWAGAKVPPTSVAIVEIPRLKKGDKLKNADRVKVTKIALDGVTPRMVLYFGGCRGMLVPYLGSKFTQRNPGTRYFCGWVYTVTAGAGDQHMLTFFQSWIKGTSGHPAPNEFDTSRIKKAFKDASALGTAEDFHPRMMDALGPIIPSKGTITDTPDHATVRESLA